MRKPSEPQATLLLAAVRNGGYATAGDVAAAKTVTKNAVKRAGWMSSDYRIQQAGREVLAAADSAAYAQALAQVPAAHHHVSATTGDPAPAHLVPDGMIQYDVPAGRGADFVGYKILHNRQLRTIVKAQVYLADDRMPACTLYVSDGKGGYRYAKTAHLDFACYGPEGGPRLDLAAEVELAAELAAAQPEMTRDLALPGTADDVIAAGRPAAGTPVTSAGRPFWGRKVSGPSNGVVDCATATAAIVVSVKDARRALAAGTNTKARSLLNALAEADGDDRLTIMDPKNHNRMPVAAGMLTAVAGAMAGYNPNDLAGLERSAVARGVPVATFRRLYPAVTRIADSDELLRRMQVARDALVRDLTELGQEITVRTVLGDPREAGYRVALYEVRTNTALPERVRKGAFCLELALTSADRGERNAAHRSIARAQTALA